MSDFIWKDASGKEHRCPETIFCKNRFDPMVIFQNGCDAGRLEIISKLFRILIENKGELDITPMIYSLVEEYESIYAGGKMDV